jgi:hypothetical protein
VASTGLWSNIAAIGATPLAVWILASGHGLLVHKVAGGRLTKALLVPVGFCLAVVLSLASYETGLGDELALPVVVGIALLGFIVSRKTLPKQLNGGWPLLAGVATYVLFNGSVIASGHWTWTGYNFSNDTATELVLIAHLQAHGAALSPGLPPGNASGIISSYLSTGYPLGAQSLLAVVSGVLDVHPVVVWQSFIASTAAVGTMAAATLSGRTMDRRLAAVAGFLAIGSALAFQYALQGAIKEIATLAAVLCALAALREAVVASDLRPASLGVIAIPLAAILATFNAAGVPYVGALAAAGLVGCFVVYRLGVRVRVVRSALAGTGAAVVALGVLAVPALLTITTFYHTASSGYSGSAPTAPALGPLLRPLPLSEVSGVWLYGDFRLPVPTGTAGVITVVATVVILLALIPATLHMFSLREPGPLMGLVANGLVLAIVYPRVVPYAQAKLLMIASPVVILVALQAFTVPRRLDWRLLAGAGAAAIGVAVLASDALAYHAWPVAPTARMVALEEVGKRVGDHGPVLDSEFEQFAKYFAMPAGVVDGADPGAPEALALREPASEYDHSFDLGEERLTFIESFPYIIVRRSPVSSRPPANYRLILTNRYYELWERLTAPHVLMQLPLVAHPEQSLRADAAPNCGRLHAAIADAPRGSDLAVATAPDTYGFAVAAVSHSPGWVPGGEYPGGVLTQTPGEAYGTISVPTGTDYKLWVQGSFPRQVEVKLDGRVVGTVLGTNTPDGWLSAGETYARTGSHVLAVVRGGGGLGPGNGDAQAAIGAVVMTPVPETAQLRSVPVKRWRSLCSTEAQWIEVVGH